MTKQEYEYYKQRKKESRYDLYETVSTEKKLRLAKIIDFTIIIIGIILVKGIADTFIDQAVIAILLVTISMIVIFNLIKAAFKGVSVGFFIIGIRYANIKSKKLISSKDYIKYTLKNVKADVRVNELYDYYFYFEERLVQNRPMKRSGILVVDVKRFKRFRREYQETLNALKEIQTA